MLEGCQDAARAAVEGSPVPPSPLFRAPVSMSAAAAHFCPSDIADAHSPQVVSLYGLGQGLGALRRSRGVIGLSGRGSTGCEGADEDGQQECEKAGLASDLSGEPRADRVQRNGRWLLGPWEVPLAGDFIAAYDLSTSGRGHIAGTLPR